MNFLFQVPYRSCIIQHLSFCVWHFTRHNVFKVFPCCAGVPNLFSTKEKVFVEKQFFHRPVGGGAWYGVDSRALHLLCTLFPLQLHLRSSGIRSQRLGTHVVACVRILLTHFHKAEWLLIVCTDHMLLIHSSLDRHLGFFCFWLMWIMLLWTLVSKYLFECLLSNFGGIYT